MFFQFLYNRYLMSNALRLFHETLLLKTLT